MKVTKEQVDVMLVTESKKAEITKIHVLDEFNSVFDVIGKIRDTG